MRIIPACLVLLLSATVLAAGKTVPGEKWQHKMTMQMGGMSMPIPTGEVCAPVGQAAAELAKPDKNCTVSNARQQGNRFTADVKCTGKEPMEGSMDMTTGPDRMTGKMIIRSSEGEMTMQMESRKLGACEAVDTGAVVARAEAQGKAAQATADNATAQMCASEGAKLKADPGHSMQVAMMFVQPGAACAGKPLPAEFCGAVQSRAGFSSLSKAETALPGVVSRSLAACKLPGDKAGIDALRAKFIVSAEAEGDGNYLVENAPARAKQLARSQCVVKGEMWGGRNAKWDNFCDSNFANAARAGQ